LQHAQRRPRVSERHRPSLLEAPRRLRSLLLLLARALAGLHSLHLQGGDLLSGRFLALDARRHRHHRHHCYCRCRCCHHEIRRRQIRQVQERCGTLGASSWSTACPRGRTRTSCSSKRSFGTRSNETQTTCGRKHRRKKIYDMATLICPVEMVHSPSCHEPCLPETKTSRKQKAARERGQGTWVRRGPDLLAVKRSEGLILLEL
jgi:hypothetical protein